MEILLILMLIPVVLIGWPLVCILLRLLFGGVVVACSTLVLLALVIGAVQ